MTDATEKANDARQPLAALMGRMTTAERAAGRFLRSPDGHPEPAPAPAPAPEPQSEPAPAAGAATEASAGAESAKTEADTSASGLIRPEGLDDEFWDDAKGLKGADMFAALREARAKIAEAEAAKGDIPENADGYEVKVSDEVKLPDGFKLDIEADSPFAAEIKAIAKDVGLTKAGFQKLLDAEAKRQIAEQNAIVEEYATQKTELGDRADARVEATKNWVLANLPEKQANALLDNMSLAAIPALEAIIALRSAPSMPGGVAGSKTNKFEGLQGSARLEAIRSQAT